MATEDVSARFQDFDAWGDLDILKALYEGLLAAVAAIATSLPAIAEAVAAAVPRLEAGGRLIYAGAGTSGRIGIQDGAELTPTFDSVVGRASRLRHRRWRRGDPARSRECRRSCR